MALSIPNVIALMIISLPLEYLYPVDVTHAGPNWALHEHAQANCISRTWATPHFWQMWLAGRIQIECY